eukprot:3587973-Alexandrium_andersonii.AAC.1
MSEALLCAAETARNCLGRVEAASARFEPLRAAAGRCQPFRAVSGRLAPVSYTHLRAHETSAHL